MLNVNIFKAINKWFRPYLYDNEIIEEKKQIKNTKKRVKKTKLTKSDKKPTEIDAVMRGELGVKIITMNRELNKESAFDRLDKSDSHVAYYYHSSERHQLAVKFEPKSGFRYYKRNASKLKAFKPFVYPIGKPYDKTHLIPVGFHGSESDPRLLIGWNSKLNRGDIRKLESKVININKDYTVLWFVDIEMQNNGSAKWTSTVWFEDGELLDEKVFHDKDKFHWSA
ncbi:hypothetical protein QCE96_08195 [Staphylococcus aureus]|nr:hypothetical protein [Staphylococcus aureus]MDG6736506.1 hypothetical protein [Staphylococcus aureus]